jgi:hypothetical protein
MTDKSANKKGWTKKALYAFLFVLVLGGAAYWYIMNEEFDDTAAAQSAYTVSAQDLINTYQSNDSLANAIYREQIITVQGRVTEVEAADTTVNIKFTDPVTGSYLIFDFQSQHVADAKVVQAGDSVSIKGSCSGNIFSQLRKAHMISFKRSVLVNKF